MISCILWTDEMLNISEDREKPRCQTFAVDQRALFCNDAIATTQVVLGQYQAF